AVNPTFCNTTSNYTYLKNVSGWSYSNGVWTHVMTSNTNMYVSGIKVKAHFRDARGGNISSGQVVEIVK
ncbi:MAG: hypothetical protein PHH06_05350, partial [Candidatus Gracilibacteria bacterium]|nr:hypothetical protein [Candidatus Gracilibacteria bacterium]